MKCENCAWYDGGRCSLPYRMNGFRPLWMKDSLEVSREAVCDLWENANEREEMRELRML